MFFSKKCTIPYRNKYNNFVYTIESPGTYLTPLSRMMKETKATSFADIVKGDKHKDEQSPGTYLTPLSRMQQETRATRFADIVKRDKHKAEHVVSVEAIVHQPGTMSHEDVSINCFA